MNFDDTPQEAEFRALARKWIEANRPDDLMRDLASADEIKDRDQRTAALVKAAKAWQKKKADAGFACLTWPKEYGGRAATPIQRVIWDQEEGKYGALSGPFAIGQGMCGPTVMAYASEDQKRRYLPPLASGEEVWCQLFSEPAGGSDLAGLRTKAERDGDDWIINGQKIWTTGAHFSDYGILITRTDPTLPKHKGLTMFFLDMKSPGVEVRPIKQASGHSGFNEVYFTNVRIPDAQRLGKVNDGWNVSLTTLMNERFSIGARLATGVPEFFDFASDTKMADGTLAIDDKAVRENLATWAARANGLKYTSYRAISALSRGERPGPENSIGKLVAAPMMQDIAMYALELQGQMGAVARDDASPAGKLYQMLYGAIGMRIAGGTDEVMRNIIAERVLGLPGDIRVDKDLPFNQVPTKGR
ncbi:MAG TPA: acyl-CoA dehydrogenase family protein [Beijerinckiaceae bacterium]|nr:acyl-CoA dehydrogenase family protein [Methylobacteriaceae bacterium]MCO5088368.1 acyl-CoA dehydrogenase family protein [Methylobacteriaceae bacterium]HRY03217.1 acyl-CoA dehydrogenase family protein [Beijerinckiaceae bacterium]